jgi:hypothetical protein
LVGVRRHRQGILSGGYEKAIARGIAGTVVVCGASVT